MTVQGPIKEQQPDGMSHGGLVQGGIPQGKFCRKKNGEISSPAKFLMFGGGGGDGAGQGPKQPPPRSLSNSLWGMQCPRLQKGVSWGCPSSQEGAGHASHNAVVLHGWFPSPLPLFTGKSFKRSRDPLTFLGSTRFPLRLPCGGTTAASDCKSRPPPPCAERRRTRKGKTGKNHCGCWKPLSGKLSCRCTPQRAQVSAGVGKPPHGLGVCIWMHLVNGTGNSPVSGTADPRSSQTGQVIRGLR